MSERVAIVGIGQTKHASRRNDLSLAGLVREAAKAALADAGMDWEDIQAVVLGTAPDMFEGVMMPELYLAEALGAVGKPILRVHTAGSVGGSAAIAASHHISSGWFDRILTIAFEKQSESEAMWALTPYEPFSPVVTAGAGSWFSPLFNAYMSRSGAPNTIGATVAAKDRQNALKNKFAHVRIEGVNVETVLESKMLWHPTRFLETCPSSDGAVAMVMTNEANVTSSEHRPAWVHATAVRSEPQLAPRRSVLDPRSGRECAQDLYRQAGITDPRREIDCAEIYVPFSWFEPLWLENLGFAEPNVGWRMTESGATSLNGDMPWNMSGGVLSTNPIGAAGMLRFAEAAMQVRNQAGDHQVENAQTAMGHAFGGFAQFFAMWIVRSDKP